jgi:sugar lactone lactonase YvrE
MSVHSATLPAALLATCLLGVLAASTPSLGGSGAAGITVVNGLSNPESVYIHGARRFVSNIGLKLDPIAKDGDGFISELSADGKVLTLHAFPPQGETLDAPKGMAVAGNTLYVSDIDRVAGFDLDSGQRVFEASLPAGAPALANDLAQLDDTSLLLSDTFRGLVYKLDLETGQFSEFATGIPGANGILTSEDGIFVAGLGEGFTGGDVFTLDGQGTPHRLSTSPHGILDGIAELPDGSKIVSDWVDVKAPVKGAFWRFSADGTSPRKIDFGMDIHGPADFAFDPASQSLWIPATLDNKVIIVPLDEE